MELDVAAPTQRRSNTDLPVATRVAILFALHNLAKDDVLPRGALTDVGRQYECDRTTVAALWKHHRGAIASPTALNELQPRRKGRCGRPSIDNETIQDAIRAVHLPLRQSVRSTAHYAGLSATTLHDRVTKGAVECRSTNLKPDLTPKHLHLRVDFCLKHVKSCGAESGFEFKGMDDTIHVDEKWFWLDKDARGYYVVPGEVVPTRRSNSKRFIGKIMFLAAVARPRFDRGRNKKFDGKLGVWPFVVEVAAKRTSKNRPAGTLELKEVNVDRAAYTSMLKDKLVPAILAKWPRDQKVVLLRQDNASAHLEPQKIRLAHGLVLDVKCQPPKSPDLNILDLGFLRLFRRCSRPCTRKRLLS